jgi:hypothetical protein
MELDGADIDAADPAHQPPEPDADINDEDHYCVCGSCVATAENRWDLYLHADDAPVCCGGAQGADECVCKNLAFQLAAGLGDDDHPSILELNPDMPLNEVRKMAYKETWSFLHGRRPNGYRGRVQLPYCVKILVRQTWPSPDLIWMGHKDAYADEPGYGEEEHEPDDDDDADEQKQAQDEADVLQEVIMEANVADFRRHMEAENRAQPQPAGADVDDPCTPLNWNEICEDAQEEAKRMELDHVLNGGADWGDAELYFPGQD